jgi:hypothetical protein
MRDGIIALIVGMVLVMSGFNSVVLLIAMENSAEPITVTVDLTGLEPGLDPGPTTELTFTVFSLFIFEFIYRF